MTIDNAHNMQLEKQPGINKHKPLILAPAGNRASFLAAVAAGADAVYCGLKRMSARMEAKNFSMEELALLTRLAHDKGVKVYVTLNALLKPGDLEAAAAIVDGLNRHVGPDALIVQDLALVQVADQVGYKGELHLSTLSNVTFSRALPLIQKKLKINRVVLPRELNIDEIKQMAAACPDEFDLESFIHGALCFGVSGRCYWSSYMGGKSGLRGRCVQPCRRVYTQAVNKGRFFSCQDLSVDVLAKVLGDVSNVNVWKIEGRKKGPHYVFYTVTAYKMLRDERHDPKKKKTALGLLSQALGRANTHYNFLPQRPQNPVNTKTQTGSGLLMGKMQGPKANPYIVPRQELLPGDLLRIGYEDDTFHQTVRVPKYIPKKGKFHIKPKGKRTVYGGAPVFLTDRKEPALEKMIAGLENEMKKITVGSFREKPVSIRMPPGFTKKKNTWEIAVARTLGPSPKGQYQGVWLSDTGIKRISRAVAPKTWVWLPPVIWPENENKIQSLVQICRNKGVRNFVLNAPWQVAFFDRIEHLRLWAGPFCNASNPLMIKTLDTLGFSGVIVSPELGKEDYLMLADQSCLPLGIVVSGHWPLCVSRILSSDLKVGAAFTSPRGEQGWASKYGSDYWLFPNWRLDITDHLQVLKKAGYSLFVHMNEIVPKKVKLKKRQGLWNWKIGLK